MNKFSEKFFNYKESESDERLKFYRENLKKDYHHDILDIVTKMKIPDQIKMMKSFFDYLTEEEIHEFYFIKECVTDLMNYCINNCDEDEFKYFVNENKVVKAYYNGMYAYYHFLNTLIEKDYFTMIEIIITSNTPKEDDDINSFYFFRKVFTFYVEKNSLYAVKTIVENFNIDPVYLIDGMFNAFNSSTIETRDTFVYLARICTTRKCFKEVNNPLIKHLILSLKQEEQTLENVQLIIDLTESVLKKVDSKISNI